MTLYDIEFTDGTRFKGGNLKNTRWDEIPSKMIKRIKYRLAGREITVEGFDAYVNVKFYGKIVNSSSGDLLYAVALMARKGNAVWQFLFNLQEHTLVRNIVPFGCENEGRPVVGWKIGASAKPIIEIK